MDFQRALEYVRNSRNSSNPLYREACETIARNLEHLPYRVFIQLPGGLRGNMDSAWDFVKSASAELCNCGNERAFEPLNPRGEFEAAAGEPVVVIQGDKVYLRPIGAPKSAAYALLEMLKTPEGLFLALIDTPFSTSINIFDVLSGPKGFTLTQLAEALPRYEGKPAVLATRMREICVPVLGISAVDVAAGTVTFLPDVAVEVFDPDGEDSHQH